MNQYLVLVIGGAEARFFKLESAEFPEIESSPKLIEFHTLTNPEKKATGREIYSDPKTGRSRAPGGGPSHGYDDHRDEHEVEFDRRFVKKIIDTTRKFIKKVKPENLIIVASSRMMGILGAELKSLHKTVQKLIKIQKDMTKFHPQQIHNNLAKEGVIPPCVNPRKTR